MIKESILSTLGIENFLNTVSHDSIPLITSVKIDNINYGRIDIFINKYYNGEMSYLSLLMDFNKISDVIEIKIGMIFEIPDFNYILQQLSLNTILEDDIIPGISQSMDSSIVNKILLKNIGNSKSTTASPKLKVTLKKVSYNEETGIISY
jgi:hypothetical protein